jgi:hypothetical protein
LEWKQRTPPVPAIHKARQAADEKASTSKVFARRPFTQDVWPRAEDSPCE